MPKSFKDTYLGSAPRREKKDLVALRLPKELKKKLQDLADEKGQTLTHAIIEALRFAMEPKNDDK